MRKSHLDDAIVGGEHHADALCGKRRDRREPRRERVDEEEGDRREDHRPVPVELALELLRRRVLLVDAARLGEAVELRERGFQVISLPYNEAIKLGGSFRCTTLPLFREA